MNDKPVYKNELADTYIYTAANGNWYISEELGSELAWISSGGSICPYKVNLSTKKWKHYTINDGWYELLGFQILPGRRKSFKRIIYCDVEILFKNSEDWGLETTTEWTTETTTDWPTPPGMKFIY